MEDHSVRFKRNLYLLNDFNISAKDFLCLSIRHYLAKFLFFRLII